MTATRQRAATRTTTDRDYGWAHQQERCRWQAVVDAGRAVCARCHRPIPKGTRRWHLDHNDTRTGYIGPSHALCNLRAGGRRGNRVMRVRRAVREGRLAVTRVRW